VLATGNVVDTDLANALRAAGVDPGLIDDVNAPLNAAAAFYEGRNAARSKNTP